MFEWHLLHIVQAVEGKIRCSYTFLYICRPQSDPPYRVHLPNSLKSYKNEERMLCVDLICYNVTFLLFLITVVIGTVTTYQFFFAVSEGERRNHNQEEKITHDCLNEFMYPQKSKIMIIK